MQQHWVVGCEFVALLHFAGPAADPVVGGAPTLGPARAPVGVMTHGRLPPAVYTDSRAASTLPPTALHLLPLSVRPVPHCVLLRSLQSHRSRGFSRRSVSVLHRVQMVAYIGSGKGH